MTFVKAKRHDIAVIVRVHTSTDQFWKKTEWKTYELVKLTRVSKGIAKTYCTSDNQHGAVHASHWLMMITSPDKQAAARELFDAKAGPFDSVDAVKDAILDRVEALS